MLITYDQHGHITNSIPANKLKMNVNGISHIKFDGSEEQIINLGDDFTVDNNNIKLNWTEYGNT